MSVLRSNLKYSGSMVIGLLSCLWIFSAVWRVDWQPNSAPGSSTVYFVTCAYSRIAYISLDRRLAPRRTGTIEVTYCNLRSSLWNPLGNLSVRPHYVSLPFFFLITLVLPFAVGPFRSFRFALWHYIAYTSLVAIELAYYRQWTDWVLWFTGE